MNKNIDVLSKSALFKGVDPEDIEKMLTCLDPQIKEYRKNECITISGEPLIGMGVVLFGSAAVTKEMVDGSRIIMKLLSQGEEFGEIILFSSKRSWPATVIAQQPCTIMYFTRSKIISDCMQVCPFHRRIVQNLLEIVSNKALMLNNKVEYLSLKGIRQKLSRFFCEQYYFNKSTTFNLPLNRNELAEFLNVSRPSMSRELCLMRDEGLIDFHKETIKLLKIEQIVE